MMFKIPNWFKKFRYEVINGELVKVINPIFIEREGFKHG